jgi:hypothetical protein
MPDNQFVKLLGPKTMYTFVLQDTKITLAKTRGAVVDAKPGMMQNYGSKH